MLNVSVSIELLLNNKKSINKKNRLNTYLGKRKQKSVLEKSHPQTSYLKGKNCLLLFKHLSALLSLELKDLVDRDPVQVIFHLLHHPQQIQVNSKDCVGISLKQILETLANPTLQVIQYSPCTVYSLINKNN